MSPLTTTTVDGGARRIDRATARLGNSAAAAAWLQSLGLNHAIAQRIGLGLDHEDERGLTLVHYGYDRQGQSRAVRHHVDVEGSVSSPVAGAPTGIWSSPPSPGRHVLVVPSIAGMWRLQAALGADLAPFIAVAPSHGNGLPLEWADPLFWCEFSAVTMLLDDALSQGGLLSTVGAAAGTAANVATPPDADCWAEALLRHPQFGPRELTSAVDDALPVGLFLDVAVHAERIEVAKVDIHGLDGQARAMRVVRVEERFPRPTGEIVRTRDLIIRSDGMLLNVSVASAPPGTPARDRVVTLSDGTRIACQPTSASSWSLASVRQFVSGHTLGAHARDGDALLSEVTNSVGRVTGLDPAAAHIAAVFVMLSHVYRLFDQLRVPIFHGGSASTRARLIGVLARLAHGGAVHSRARGDVLATTACEVGGAILLDEPGPLMGPGGATEAGRFLLASSFADAVWDRSSGSGPRTRSVFGPRAVFAQRAPCACVGDVEVCVPLNSEVSVAERDETALRNLTDRLYLWSMLVFRFGGLAELEKNADLSASIRWLTTENPARANVEQDQERVGPLDAEQVMTEAFAACIGPGVLSLSITHLMMEVALRGGRGAEFSPERVGRWLAGSGLLATGAPASRRRLHGHISRIYQLDRPGAASAETADPFMFCSTLGCSDCKYRAVCEDVAPGMMACKMRQH